MQKLFANMFSRQPLEIIDGDYYYESAKFSHFESKESAKKDFVHIEDAWEQKRKGEYYDVSVLCDKITSRIAEEGKPFIEIACGTPMGIAPVILIKNPAIPCLITDLKANIINSCRYYINRRLPESNISLACFNCQDMPIKDNSFDYVTGNQGLGFCACNDDGFTLQAVHEVYRVLKFGGCYVGIENEYEHNEASAELLKWQQANLEYQDGFLKNKLTWKNIFETVGFKIESSDKCTLRITREMCFLNPNDNNNCEKIVKFNSDLISMTTLFIVRK